MHFAVFAFFKNLVRPPKTWDASSKHWTPANDVRPPIFFKWLVASDMPRQAVIIESASDIHVTICYYH